MATRSIDVNSPIALDALTSAVCNKRIYDAAKHLRQYDDKTIRAVASAQFKFGKGFLNYVLERKNVWFECDLCGKMELVGHHYYREQSKNNCDTHDGGFDCVCGLGTTWAVEDAPDSYMD